MPTPAYTNLDSNKPSGSDSPTTYATDNLNNIRALRDMVITGRAAGFVQTRTQGTGPDVARPQYITWLNSSLQVGFRMKSTWGGTGNCQQTSVEWEWTNDNGSSWTTLGTAQANTFDANDNITATTNSGGFVALVMEMWTKLLRYVGAIKVDAATNNVGIGTSSPGYKLDVESNPIRVAAASSGAGYIQYGKSATATNNWHLGSEGDGNFRLWNGNYGAGSLRVSIDSSGNVGIGTSSPTFKLVSANSATDGGWLYSSGAVSVLGLGGYANAGDGAFQIRYDRTSGAITFNGGSRDTPAQRILIDANGNVAIKTVGAWLGFPDSGGALSAFGNGMFIGTSGQQLRLIAGNSDGTIAFSTTSTAGVANERMRIDSSGNLLMSQAISASQVDNAWTVYKDTNDAGDNRRFEMGAYGAAVADGWFMRAFGAAGTTFLKSDSGFAAVIRGDTGNVGIGTSSPQALVHADLFAAPSVTAPTSGYLMSYNAGSNAASAGYGVWLDSDNGDKKGYFGADRTSGDSFNGITAAATSNHPMRFLTNNTERLRITEDGRLYGTALHNNAGSVTGTANQYIASGTMANGNATAVTNVSGTPTYQTMTWMRVGNVVTVAGTVTAAATTANTACSIRFPAPIASAFTAIEDCAGSGTWTTGDNGEPVRVRADEINDEISVRWVPTSTTNTVMPIHFTYLIK